jgi:hypothetical protein
MELCTIQKRNKLNKVFAVDDKGPGEAYHAYDVILEMPDGNVNRVETIVFQKGPRKDPNAISGLLDVDLLEIVRHRLQCFQEGEFATRENAIALTHIEEALLWMNKRVEDRAERGVLGTNNK